VERARQSHKSPHFSTSSSEGFSLTTLQAMAYGVPVIAAHNGGQEDITPDVARAPATRGRRRSRAPVMWTVVKRTVDTLPVYGGAARLGAGHS